MNFKRQISLFSIFVCFPVGTFLAQGDDTLKVKDFEDIEVKTKGKVVRFKNLGLYDYADENTTPHIRDFTALELYGNAYTDEIWSTENLKCISIKETADEKNADEKYLSITWDKIKGGCDWIGMGFGWDNWSGKDISSIIDTAAIQLLIRTKSKPMSNMPIAIGFEDYTNKQAWIGFSSTFISGGSITDQWTVITIPLNLFPFEERQVDPAAIKQMIIQFEAEGTIELDDVRIVPYSGKSYESINALPRKELLVIDGMLDTDEWNFEMTPIDKNNYFAMQYDADNLYIALKISDTTPLINTMDGANIWNGDGIEIAFGANPEANKKRKFYLLSDLQLGVRVNDDPMVWNWKSGNEVTNAKVKIQKTDNGYVAEIQLPIYVMTGQKLESGKIHGFELAIDQSGSGSTRASQIRWNSKRSDGFNSNPSLWGEVVLK